MKKRNTLTLIALLFVAVLTGVVIFNTVAKYTSSVENSGSLTVAKWNFTTDNALASNTFNISIAPTATPSTLVANKVAPGTSGSFDIVVSNSSEVGVDVTVAIGAVTGGTLPAGLHFYSDSTYETAVTPGTTTYTGKIAASNGSTKVSLPTKTIYWKWDYQVGSGETLADNDAADTTAGVAGASLTIPVTITGTQVEPSASTTVTTGWNQ